ncbi:tyrosine-type recombinase/integrase [Phytoactinopolyspora mesophila]|uniref:Tyrosine-type recombinase/integrase n=1 Tax=Phytoactinopolyspora mesophila TaxID=2650750 RepID=A0A7K3MDN0_9ACTN|nr:tyrosine-type recombinase/integrase [Phytoactinopolyspora mesophila]NDL61112.1 tyrosine-type recombinase/integrase [Phytoactinopolyspora mesophila]
MAYVQAACPPGGTRTWTVVNEKYEVITVIDEWLESHRNRDHGSPNTVNNYATSLAQWWTFLELRGEADQWNALGAPTLASFLTWLRNGRTSEHVLIPSQKSPSPATLQARLAAVISFYRWHGAMSGVPVIERVMRGPASRRRSHGLLAHLAARSPLRATSLVRVRRPRGARPPVLKPKEWQAILDACAVFNQETGEWTGNLRDRFLFALLQDSGLRLGEALGMRIKDFAALAEALPYVDVVPREDNSNGARVKGMRFRVVYVSHDLRELFTDYVTHMTCRAADEGITITLDSPLFVNLYRPPLMAAMRPETVYDKVNRLKKNGVGPKEWTPHWFRHSHATEL